MYCPACQAPARWVWRISPLNCLLTVFTLGLWLWVARPYTLRCASCGISAQKAARKLQIMGDILSPVEEV